MEWLEYSRACLNEAHQQLVEITNGVEELELAEELDPTLRVKIKNFLENCRSPLDYSALFIFDTYCKTEYSPEKLKHQKTYFPIRDNRNKFDGCIKKEFKGLKEKSPNVVSILLSHQPFKKGNSWLHNLSRLVIDNKHKNLTKSNRYENGVSASSITLINGNVLKNIVSFDNGGANIMIGDIPFDFKNADSHPYVKSFDATFYTVLRFDDLDIPVSKTLKEIYEGTCNVINDLERHFSPGIHS
ncbi:hypothetical protein JY98_03830 [Exiguobacterium mexicanum]|nr:hypothetical protein JY98_03830 [Exiguobacterium mexicanum]